MKAIVTFLLFSSIGLSACGQESSSRGGVDTVVKQEIPEPNQTQKFDYAKIMYAEQGTCGSKGGVYFKYLLVEDTLVGKSERGKDLLAEVRVVLSPNRKFTAIYDEKEVDSYTASGYTHKRRKSRMISGYWSPDGDSIKLGDFIKIKARMEENRVRASVVFLRDVISTNVEGMKMNAAMVWSTSPGTKSYSEVCPTSENQLGSFSKYVAQSDPQSTKLSSLQLPPGKRFEIGQYLVNDVQMFVHKSGFDLLLQVIDMKDPNYELKHYVVENSFWEKTAANSLSLYIGRLSLKDGDVPQLCLTKDLFFVTEEKEILDFQMNGRCIKLEYRASNYTLDDLTSNYR